MTSILDFALRDGPVVVVAVLALLVAYEAVRTVRQGGRKE